MNNSNYPTAKQRQAHARRFLQTLCLALVCAVCAGSAPGQIRRIQPRPLVAGVPGELDSSFGAGGKVNTDILESDDEAKAVALQPDGRIIAAGSIWNGGAQDFALIRYLPDGSLDSTFGIGGKVTTRFPTASYINAIALQPNGRIVVAGCANAFFRGRADLALARYTRDGALDGSFGYGGLVITDVLNLDDYVTSLALQPDGKIIAGAVVTNQAANFDFALIRYNSDGSLDTTFGPSHTGKVVTDVAGASDLLFAIALLSDGRIMAGGGTVDPFRGINFCLARYTAAGTLDASFGDQGIVQTAFFGPVAAAYSLALQSDGKIVLAGCVLYEVIGNPPRDRSAGALARYNPDGSLDPSFGDAGKMTIEFAGQDFTAYAEAILSNGGIIIGGPVVPDVGEASFGLACFTNDGMLDRAFGGSGAVVTDFFGLYDSVFGVALQPDGKVVAVGSTVNPSDNLDFALARYAMGDDFSVSPETPAISASRGTAVRVRMSVNRTSSSVGAVTVTPPDTSGIGVKMKPPLPQTTTESGVSFKLKIKEGAVPGPQLLTFTATDSKGRSRSATVTLTIE